MGMCLRNAFLLCLIALVGVFQPQAAGASQQPLLLVSLDGFRWDYLDRFPESAPTLCRLRQTGASVRGLVPVFPSNTFPDHYTIVTGLWPEHHGMLNNTFFDPVRGLFFRNTIPTTVRDPAWWGGEPLWATAVKQGRTSATYFWPGSEAAIQGVHATWWMPFDYSVPFEKRLDVVDSWIRSKSPAPPAVTLFYFEETNTVGHRHGPDSPQIVEAIKKLDTQLAALLERFERAGFTPNVVIVSDHGMAAVKPERNVALDAFIDPTAVQIDFSGPVAGLRPLKGSVDDVLRSLEKVPTGVKVYRLTELPARFHLGQNPRVPPVFVVPEEGGWADTQAGLAQKLATTRGEHGYDPELPSMHGILVVHGPAFRSDGFIGERVENVHVYNLLCFAAGLKAAPNDGDDRLIRALGKQR
jgi:predicted AlkP superfamily pyrophosphatase or phosphodiesterase